MSIISIPTDADSQTKTPTMRNEHPDILSRTDGSSSSPSDLKCPNPKDSDCICSICIQDKQYLIWELEA